MLILASFHRSVPVDRMDIAISAPIRDGQFPPGITKIEGASTIREAARSTAAAAITLSLSAS